MTNATSRRIARELLTGHRLRLLALAAVSIVGGFMEAAFLVILTRAAFAISAGKDQIGTIAGIEFSVIGTVALALGLVMCRIAASLTANALNATLNAEVTRSLRQRLASSFLRATWPAQQASRTGQLQELLINYAHAGSSFVGGLATILSAGGTLAALLALATAVDAVGSLIAIGAMVVLGLLLRPLRRAVGGRARAAADDGMALSVATSEISSLGMAVQVFDVRDAVEQRIVDLQTKGVQSTRRLALARGMVPALYSGLAYVALVGAVALASAWETATLTSLGAVMLVMLRSLSYGQQLQLAYTSIQSSMPHLDDVFAEVDRYDEQRFVDHGDPVVQVCPLRLDRVSFHYQADVPVLSDVSFDLRQGELVGLVGPSGSGKSTLVQVLLGLRQPDGGGVFADGVDIRSLRHADWARKVTFVPQAAVLVSGSVADNIRFYRAGIDDVAVERAARAAGLHDEIVGFPGGYAYDVGDKGGRLSGGQQQRLCIARALVGDPEVVILDEPTSALDAYSEMVVRTTLASLTERAAVLVIAHRMSTLAQCHRVIVLEGGRVTAEGPPFHLMERPGFFADAMRLGAGH